MEEKKGRGRNKLKVCKGRCLVYFGVGKELLVELQASVFLTCLICPEPPLHKKL